MKLFMYYLIVVSVMSIITLAVYYFDKRRAIKGKYRIKESILLFLSIFFGATGGLIALYKVRHKNKHWYFVLINILAFLAQIALGIYLVSLK